MEDLFNFDREKNQMKELSPHTYYKPFNSTFDREFLLFQFGKKSEAPKRREYQRKPNSQPSWSVHSSSPDPNSPCTSDDSNNTGSELSVHSKPFFPDYYLERNHQNLYEGRNQTLYGEKHSTLYGERNHWLYNERNQTSYGDLHESLPSSSPLSTKSYNFVPGKEPSDLHDYSLSFYNSNLVSPIEKVDSTFDTALQPGESLSSKYGAYYNYEDFLPLRVGSLSFEDDTNDSFHNMDNISTASSQDHYSNRRKPKKDLAGYAKPMICNFCKNNKEVPQIFLNHYLYDPVTKILSCPVLRKHVCEICGKTGDAAHTLQYCPVNREKGIIQGKVAVLLKTRTVTNSTGKLRRN